MNPRLTDIPKNPNKGYLENLFDQFMKDEYERKLNEELRYIITFPIVRYSAEECGSPTCRICHPLYSENTIQGEVVSEEMSEMDKAMRESSAEMSDKYALQRANDPFDEMPNDLDDEYEDED